MIAEILSMKTIEKKQNKIVTNFRNLATYIYFFFSEKGLASL